MQTEDRENRRLLHKALAKRIGAMSAEERQAKFAGIGIVTVEGHALSFFNCCMIFSQNSSATMVAGFNQWRAHGRVVRKGESGLAIFCPRCSKSKDDEGNTVFGGAEGFFIGYVFDITQTQEIGVAVECAVLA